MRWPWNKRPRFSPPPKPDLTAEQRAFFSETITQINPIYNPALDIPGITMSPTIQKRRFEIDQCLSCGGIHSNPRCRRVKHEHHWPNGEWEADYWQDGEWDESGVIWREQVFGIAEDDGKPSTDSAGTDGRGHRPADVA